MATIKVDFSPRLRGEFETAADGDVISVTRGEATVSLSRRALQQRLAPPATDGPARPAGVEVKADVPLALQVRSLRLPRALPTRTSFDPTAVDADLVLSGGPLLLVDPLQGESSIEDLVVTLRSSDLAEGIELTIAGQVKAPAGEPGALEEWAGEDGAEEEAVPDAAREARRNAELARLPRAGRQQQLEEIRSRLQALGDVNLGAIEEHEELVERFRFLSEQRADLDATLASLHDAIQRINRTSRRRFRETFEAVSKRFSENFPRLFRGGKASLSLTETEDVLEAGIEIMAMPPGKRLQNVNLLSGGEKTLTAVALLVAVFQVRPSPFFLLDEVDAALDDANIERFNEIVKELCLDSQFVLITHNKRTIEVADVLYGVTMERKGISKLVSVELR